MKILDQSREGTVAKVHVEVPAEELLSHFEEAYKKARKEISLDGFRKGKVPLQIIKKKFGPSIRYDSIDDFINKIYPKILEETELRPITPGDVEGVEFEDGSDLRFTVVMELKPEFELAEWRGQKILRDVVEVSDEDLEHHLKYLSEENALVQEKTETEPAEMTDRIKVNLQKLDSTGLVLIGEKRTGLVIELGKDVLGPGTDEQLVGICKGETRRILTRWVKVDEKGEEVEEEFGWEVFVEAVESVDVPEINDDFATTIDPQVTTLEELRANTRRNLEAFAAYQANQKMANRLINKMVELNPIELPPTLLTQTIAQLVESHKDESQNMIPESEIQEHYSKVAESQLRWFFIREKLIEEENLQATEEDVQNFLKNKADTGSGDLESLKLMFKTGEKRQALEDEIVDGKVMDILHEGFEFDDRKTTLSEYMQ